ncbi:MAG: histidine kinase [Nocardioides sp.]|uniref:sensor histidine kinase n=1 Tax=Nocardioides sp. TaxID=35761 RepID=UPI0039E3C97D
MKRTSWLDWVPEVVLAILVLAIALWQAPWIGSWQLQTGDAQRLIVITYLLPVAVGLCRHLPSLGLVIVAVIGYLHIGFHTPFVQVEIAALLVVFGAARWGRSATAGAGLMIGLLGLFMVGDDFGVYQDDDRGLIGSVSGSVILLLCLGAWLIGIALRFLARSQSSERSKARAEDDAARAMSETAQAQEIARLQEEQARLARDVHDVVGHSLAVILAQAESAQFVDDATKLKQTMATVADAARSSLQDVRQVLAGTRQPFATTAGLDELIAGLRAGGHRVEVNEIGRPRPLPPEIDTVAYRVLQEMLTNALKHGRRDRPVMVERDWNGYAGDLRLEVTNLVPVAADQAQPMASQDLPGHGLAGMRRRLDAVGGHLDVRRKASPEGTTFAATAWIPAGGSR